MHEHETRMQQLESLRKELRLPSRIQELHLPEWNLDLKIKRDDLIHPIISGNKWRKLQGHLDAFFASGKTALASIGGKYSNHLHALAYLAHRLEIPCTLLIYGWQNGPLTPALQDCIRWGANLLPVSRTDALALRSLSSGANMASIPEAYWIPEGGSGEPGMAGFHQWVNEMPEGFDQPYNQLYCGCGTGTTIQGILKHTRHVRITTCRVVRNALYDWEQDPRIRVLEPEGIGSFGKPAPALRDFMELFFRWTGIPLDPVYTAPLVWMLTQRESEAGDRELYLLHSGGLQGLRRSPD